MVIAWHLLANPDMTHHELGDDWRSRRVGPARQQARLVAQLKALGPNVEVTPAA